ncbi:scabin-related ADP-ribosyltransferase, partial [Amycolatopsis rhizosphaerae]|uniref:scabin-related ADP-ribosyltransferase n=1 Tax=Amycolatopsis rhizosphaerae TaxID=2053003 RepID=UPI003CCC897F
VGDGAKQFVLGLGGLIGYADGRWSWSNAGTAWKGMAKFGMAAFVFMEPTGIGRALDMSIGIPGFKRGEFGKTLLSAGKGLIAYDEWKTDKSRAGGTALFNVVTAIVGTKGAGAALRGAGAAAEGSRVAAIARAGSAMSRGGELVANLPTVGDGVKAMLQRMPIRLPELNLSAKIGDLGAVKGINDFFDGVGAKFNGGSVGQALSDTSGFGHAGAPASGFGHAGAPASGYGHSGAAYLPDHWRTQPTAHWAGHGAPAPSQPSGWDHFTPTHEHRAVEPAQPVKEPDWNDPIGHLRDGTGLNRDALEKSLMRHYEDRELVYRTDHEPLFRHDDRPPAQIFDGKQGFTGRGHRINLAQHVADVRGGLVSTTRDMNFALDRASRGERGVSYVYEIDAPGGIDMRDMNIGDAREGEVAFAHSVDVKYIKSCMIVDRSTGEVLGHVSNPHYYGLTHDAGSVLTKPAAGVR